MNLLEQVKGHEKARQFFKGAMVAGRLPSAVTFAGPPSVGKKKMALAIAQAYICTQSKVPLVACGQCGPCKRVAANQSEGLLLIEPDGLSIKVEQAKTIQAFLRLQVLGKARVIIIDQAEAMTPVAANSLLKVLEEPPRETYFFLITSNLDKILPTIRSRAPVIRFAGLAANELQQLTGAPNWMLEASRGRVDEVQRLLDPENKSAREAVFEFFKLALSGRATVEVLKECLADQAKALAVAETLKSIVRDSLIVMFQNNESSGLLNPDRLEDLEKAAELPAAALSEACELLISVQADLERYVDRVLVFEDFAIRVNHILCGSTYTRI